MLEQQRREVLQYALEAEQSGLCMRRSGNFSIIDRESGLVCVTPSGMDRTEMTWENIVVINMEGETVEAVQGCRATSEAMVHLAAYKARPDIGAIAHTHSKTATAFAVMNKPIPAIIYEMFTLGCKEGYIPVAPYARPGTPALAESVLPSLQIADIILMQAHGVLAVAKNMKEALLRAMYAEELAEIYYKALTVLGHEPATLPIEELNSWRYPDQLK